MRGIVHFARALALRCPVCGGGHLFHHWFKIKDHCPTCGFAFARGESGYQLGSMALDLIIPLLIWLGSLFIILVTTWPSPPWALIQWGSIVVMLGLPLLLYPASNTLAIALDVIVRPPDAKVRDPGGETE